MRYWVLEVVELDTGRFIVEGTEYEVVITAGGPNGLVLEHREMSDVDTFGDFDGYDTHQEAMTARDEIQPHV